MRIFYAKSKYLYISYCHTYKLLYAYVYYWQRVENSVTQKAYIKTTFNIHLSYRGLRLPKKTEVLNIRLPDELILELDSLVKKKVFRSRSEAVREFAREYVQSQMRVKENQNKKSGQGGEGW
jgi:hypothetical protein